MGEANTVTRTGIEAELFRHVSTETSTLYRAVMQTFAAAKRQFRLHLLPDEVLVEGHWDGLAAPPRLEDLQAALAQLTEWGDLESQPDTTRVASIADFYRQVSVPPVAGWIANHLLRHARAAPRCMGTADYEAAAGAPTSARHALSGPETKAVWDTELAQTMRRYGLAIAEEAVADSLVGDLSQS